MRALAGSTRRSAASTGPVFGTCAGMIVLDRDHLGLVDIAVRRNAFGRQVASFETDLELAGRERAAARGLHPGALDRGGRPGGRGARRVRRPSGARAGGALPRRRLPSGADRRHAAPRAVPRLRARRVVLSGHSKWSSIKHKKGAADAKRGKLFSKLARSIIVAAKEGGGDPANNLALQNAIEKAKSYSMPKDNIDRAIAKGAGDGRRRRRLRDVVYEGYGPEGVAVIVEALTDNRNRTASDVRHAFAKFGGNLGTTGRGRLAVRAPRRRRRRRRRGRRGRALPRRRRRRRRGPRAGRRRLPGDERARDLAAVRDGDRGGRLRDRVGRALARPEDDRRGRRRGQGAGS